MASLIKELPKTINNQKEDFQYHFSSHTFGILKVLLELTKSTDVNS